VKSKQAQIWFNGQSSLIPAFSLRNDVAGVAESRPSIPVGWLILLGYSATVVWLVARHAMWRDEAQLWLLGASQSSLADVWASMDNEVRPLTWVTITWLLGRFTTDIEILKVVNLMVSVVTAWVIVFLLPLHRFQQLLMLSGMVLLLGYSVISEDYMLSTMLLMLTIAGMVRGWPAWVVVVLIGLSGSVHLLFTLIAAGLLAGVLVDWYLPRSTPSERMLAARSSVRNRSEPTRELAAMAFAITSIVFAVVSSWPSPDNIWRPQSSFSPWSAVSSVSNGVVLALVPSFNDQPPRTLILVPLALASIALILTLIVAAWRTGRGLGVAVGMIFTLLLANRAFGYQYARWWHSGVIALAVLAVMILLGPRGRDRKQLPQRGLLLLSLPVLLLQAAASLTEPGRGLWDDRPYSNARATAEYIRSVCPDGCPVIADMDYRSSAISAYLDGEPIYYVNGRYWGTFTIWSTRTFWQPGWPEMLAAARSIGDPIIVTSGLSGVPLGVERLATFDGAVWVDENFTVYRLN
jgi:hypothetical protein